ncbi:MAG: HNH endonuclease [Clostridia bacterium]|nr:HNH endonuclease [Clostridia bacterium]
MEDYVYKKEVDWSLFNWGMTLPVDNQVVFGTKMNRFLQRGESKEITLYLDGKSYRARIINVNFNSKFNRKKDTLQIRYGKEFSMVLQGYFSKSYQYILNLHNLKKKNEDRTQIVLPEEYKEYLAIYTTEDDDSYVLETIFAADMTELKIAMSGKQERQIETAFNYETEDENAGINITDRTIKIRKLNRKIGDNLKLLYGYRCQICGRLIGEEYDSHVCEAHHIDYFVNSLNNDSSNQLIVCPNHHSIIHDKNPEFDRKRLLYIYQNGKEERLMLNQHLM